VSLLQQVQGSSAIGGGRYSSDTDPQRKMGDTTQGLRNQVSDTFVSSSVFLFPFLFISAVWCADEQTAGSSLSVLALFLFLFSYSAGAYRSAVLRLSSARQALCLLSVYRATHLRVEWPSSRLINKNAQDSACVFSGGASHLPLGASVDGQLDAAGARAAS
jgi:hypothetical protein